MHDTRGKGPLKRCLSSAQASCLGSFQVQGSDLDQSRLVAWLTKQEVDNRYVVYVADQEPSAPAKLFDLTLPIVSFFPTAKVSAMLQLLRDGEVLVDGAVLNNLPSDVMERFSGGGPIVAVNVFPDVDIVKEYQFDPSVSGWEGLLRQLNPLTESMQVPWLFENLVRILSLNDVQQARTKRNLADVYIRPPVERFNILGFGSYEEIIEIGYEAARGQIEQCDVTQFRRVLIA